MAYEKFEFSMKGGTISWLDFPVRGETLRMGMRLFEKGFQIFPGNGIRDFCNVFRGSFCDDVSAGVAVVGPNV